MSEKKSKLHYTNRVIKHLVLQRLPELYAINEIIDKADDEVIKFMVREKPDDKTVSKFMHLGCMRIWSLKTTLNYNAYVK